MVALYFLGIVLGYVLLAIVTTFVVVRSVGKRGAAKRGKILAGFVTLFIFWLIPFWDWIPTIIYHKHLCNTEAGVKIYRTVEGVEGFTGGGPWTLTLGYMYGYGSNNLGGFVRFRKNPDKSSAKPWVEEPAAHSPEYGVRFEQLKLDKWNAWRVTQTVYVVKTGEVLATFTDFGSTAADPNVSMSEWRKPWLSGRSCFHEDGASDEATRTEIFKDMLLKTLKPLQAKN